MNTYKNGQKGIDPDGNFVRYTDEWIIPLNKHNEINKAATIYRASKTKLKQIKPEK